MLNALSDLRGEVLVRANIATTASGFLTDEILNDWINQAYAFTASYRKWPFTERRDNTATFDSATEDYAYPSDFRIDSIRILQIADKRLQKLNFEDYQIYREENPSGQARIWSDFGRRYYINPKIDISGTITAWGQYTPVPLDITDHTATTVFSAAEEEGNDALVEEVLRFLRVREKKFQESQFHHNRALEILEGIWRRMQDEQYLGQTKNRNIFKRMDLIDGIVGEENLFKRDRFY